MKFTERILNAAVAVALILPVLASCSKEDTLGPDDIAGEDTFVGKFRELILGPETDGFESSSFTLVLEAPDGSVIKREGSHTRKSRESFLTLTRGLADGTYRLLYLEYPIEVNPDLADLADEFRTTQFGLGSRIEVKNGAMTVLDVYDEEIGLPGRGTSDEPYEISSYNSLIKLAQIVNSDEKNGLITKDTHFRQTGKIDLYQASREVDRRYGWLPIGENSTLPFRGHYHGAQLSTMIIDRPNSAAVGLFGYVHNAAFYDVQISNSAVSGNFAAGALVGASLMSGSDRGLLTMTGCRVTGCELTGSDQSVSVGGLLGAVDMQSRAVLQSCSSTGNTIIGSYNAGGLVGGAGLYSAVSFSSCANSSPVTSEYSGAGGLIGSCDTIQAASSWNSGSIMGGTRYSDSDKKNAAIGAGGLIGGVGTATLSSCHNTGEVKGYAGVGGLVGSSRVKGSDSEAYMYNNVMLRYCWNEGNVSATDCAGGLVGEAQTGTYAVYNKGNVQATRYVGGIAGCTSIAVTHNAINLGKVKGDNYVAGIVGKTQFGSLALDHNYGEVTADGRLAGGIVALAGNNTMINYCGNFAAISCSENGAVGGIVAEIGDPRTWTAMNYAECIIGSAEVLMGFMGPVIAFNAKAIEAFSHTLEIALHVGEVMTDAGLLAADTVLWSMGMEEMLSPEEVDSMATELTQEVNEVNNEVKRIMSEIRGSDRYSFSGFDRSPLTGGYLNAINSNLNFYEADGGDVKFNGRINELREEREEALEKTHETNEIIHQCVAGVCIVVGTVATIGGAIATGGVAVPFVLAGAAASIAGGVNAITKTALEFQENVVIISQCVNTGDISAPESSEAAGLVGRLHDNSILRDCLNMGNGPKHGYPFACYIGPDTRQLRLISLADYKSWYNISGMSKDSMRDCVLWYPQATDSEKDGAKNRHVTFLTTAAEVRDPATYRNISSAWSIGSDDSLWVIGSGSTNAYPVPAWSEMTREE